MKETFNFNIFKSNIEKIVSRAEATIDKLHDYYWRQDLMLDTEIDDFQYAINEEKKNNDEEALNYQLNSIINRVFITLDYLGLNATIEKFKLDLEKKSNSELIRHDSWIDIYYSPKLVFLKDFINSILVGQETENGIFENNSYYTLERILKGTPKIIFDRDIEPKNEAEVQREVQKVLIHMFPDTLREFSIPKIAKSYKPDFGIKSLKCAIEYKFVDSEDEAKKFIGSIFEDVGAYEGYEYWKHFYAVIYMTKPFLTQDQVEEEFKIAKIPKNWKPIIVYGVGGRKRNKN